MIDWQRVGFPNCRQRRIHLVDTDLNADLVG